MSKHRNGTVKPVERVSGEDHAAILSLKTEIGALRDRQRQLQREVTLVSADLIRRQDALEGKIIQLADKHGLKKGQRELDLSTGEIVSVKGEAR